MCSNYLHTEMKNVYNIISLVDILLARRDITRCYTNNIYSVTLYIMYYRYPDLRMIKCKKIIYMTRPTDHIRTMCIMAVYIFVYSSIACTLRTHSMIIMTILGMCRIEKNYF